jgi:hypothetical protein
MLAKRIKSMYNLEKTFNQYMYFSLCSFFSSTQSTTEAEEGQEQQAAPAAAGRTM